MFAGLTFYYDKKRKESEEYKLKVSETIEELEKNNGKLIEKQAREMEDKFSDKMEYKLKQKFEKQISFLKEDYDEYREKLLRKIGQTTEPIETRQSAAETVRWQAWHKIHPSLSDALKNNNWADSLSVWNDFHEFQFALASLLSPKQEEIFDGLGRFVKIQEKKKLPDEFWNLILILNKQKRFKSLGVSEMLDRLGEKMGRSLNEVPPSSQENED